MSSSTPTLKFLIDENVRIELVHYLKAEKYSVKIVIPQSRDTEIAAISKKESRILVTNDTDFSKSLKDEIYSVIWLRIPQRSSELLLSAFKKLLHECKVYQGKTIVLSVESWKSNPLGEAIKQ